jgi:CubicO group peptidase (beta-lactamase class C family)
MSFVRLPTVVALFVLVSFARADTAPSIDEIAEKTLKTFDVPGVAVGVVKEGKLVFAKGYGVRKLGESAPVTPETLFGIASHTKAFTTAALAILVDEGKLKWDDPVVDQLPDFQLHDPYVTRELTIRDLLCHRCGLGLGAGDLLFFPPSDFTRAEIVKRLRHVKPASSFRSKYAYNNNMYLVAGQVIEKVSGKSWDDFITERIFKKLGMNASNTSVKKYNPGDNVAYPHAKENDKLVPLPFSPLDNNAPAGAINSSVNDVSKWVIAQLNGGKIDDKNRLFSAAQAKEMWTGATIVPISPAADALGASKPNFSEYALGWLVSDYRSKKLVWHTGGLAGMVTRITLVPEAKVGVIVLTNQETGFAFNALTYALLDEHLGVKEKTDWVKLFNDVRVKREKEADEKVSKAAEKRNKESKPSLPLKSYAGRWRDAWYGDVLIDEKDGKLSINFTHSPDLVGVLEHFQYDTFIAKWNKRSLLADAYLTFTLKADGTLDSAKMAAVSPLTDFSYDFHDLLLQLAPKDSKPR